MSGNRAAILLVLAGIVCISINDATVKGLSERYPLHQLVFVRSVIAIPFTLLLVRMEGGWSILRPARPGLQALRALLIVVANMLFFAAVALLPLATATALFFVAPLFITLLAIPVLGERVGPRRLGAVMVGFLGVVVIMGPGEAGTGPAWAYALPVAAALCYAGMQLLTRKLAAGAKASAMAVYIQGSFVVVSAAFWLAFGDGHLAEGQANGALQFLFRAWAWPEGWDAALFLLIGLMVAVTGYSLSQAYRLGDAATVSSYEYAALPLAILWGWALWGELPAPRAWLGIALIMGAGLYVFLRERRRDAPLAAERPVRRG